MMKKIAAFALGLAAVAVIAGITIAVERKPVRYPDGSGIGP